ncbi:MAG: SusC/RagA family TonB-linked outer membrane protein [Bacteroidota bacterium]
MRKFLLFMVLSVFTFGEIWAQDRNVSGKVTAIEDGATIPGVNVVLKGTTNGTVTDIDGNFKLSVPASGGILIFSFIGYQTQEVEIGNREVIDVQLNADITTLTEVVVTAAGIERQKKALGYSTQDVAGEQLAQKSTNNVFESLQGKVAGLRITTPTGAPGGGQTILLRGVTSIAGSNRNQPLIVVDGTPINIDNVASDVAAGSAAVFGTGSFGGGAIDINPDDIESVNVLKGAAAAALYGIRGANGAIIINTKKANRQKGLSIKVNSSFNVSQVNILPQYQNEYGQGLGFRHHSPVSSNSWGRRFGAIANDSITDHTGTRVVYEAYPNNVSDFFDDGYLWNNNVQLSGGNGNSGFILSVGRTDQEGIIPNSFLERTNVRLGGTTEVIENFFINGNLNFIRRETQGSPQGNSRSSVYFILPSLPRSYDLQGRPVTNPDGTQNFYSTTIDHPLWSTENNPNVSDQNRVIGNIGLNYDVTDWLNISYSFGMDVSGEDRQSVFARSSRRFNEGLIIEEQINQRLFESNFIVGLSKNISQDLTLDVKVGHNINSTRRDRFIVQATGLTTPGINNILNAEDVTVDTRNGVDYWRRLVGVFGDVSLGYKDWAFLNISARNDWSSTLPQENRSFLYPQVSGSFIPTEAFNIQNDILSFAKVKASWARVGNDADPFLTSTVYIVPTLGNNVAQVNFPFNGVASFTQSNVRGNNTLVPEENTQIELGAELGFWGDRIKADFTWYNQDVRDQIFPLTIPASTGFTSFVTNTGLINNSGIELVITANPVRTGDFNWDVIVNWTRIRNRVEELAEGIEASFLSGFTGAESSVVVGEPVGVFRGQEYLRDTLTGELLVINSGINRGQLVGGGDITIVGDPNPDWNGSLINTFSWKGIRLSAQLDMQKGGDVWSNTIGFATGLGALEETGVDRDQPRIVPGVLADAQGNVILDDDGNRIPNNIQVDAQTYWRDISGSFAESSVFDASHIRLREITVGYTLPKTLVDKLPFGSVDFSFSARNLWTYAPNLRKHIDPEVANSTGALARGLEWNSGPGVRNYGFNLSFTF